MDQLASLQIALAAIALHRLLARHTEHPDRCEWMMALLLLNAAALALWNAAHGPAALSGLWLRHACAAGAAVSALRLGLALRKLGPQQLRRFLAPVSYVAVTLAATLLSPTARAQEQAVSLPPVPEVQLYMIHAAGDDSTGQLDGRKSERITSVTTLGHSAGLSWPCP
jgi:hypothetical protein